MLGYTYFILPMADTGGDLLLKRSKMGKQAAARLPANRAESSVVHGEDFTCFASLTVAVRGFSNQASECWRGCISDLLRYEADPGLPGLQIESLVGSRADLPEHLKTVFGAGIYWLGFEAGVADVGAASHKADMACAILDFPDKDLASIGRPQL